MDDGKQLRLLTRRLVLRVPPPEDAERVLAYYLDNRAHLAPWEPLRADDFPTLRHCRGELRRAQIQLAEGSAVRLFGVSRVAPEGPLVCQVGLNNIIRGGFQACFLGYSVAARCEGQGLAAEAVEAAVQHAFRGLGLHRVMANYVPENERSGRLLRRLGFRVEGYARDYMKIAGCYRDHILTARLNPHA